MHINKIKAAPARMVTIFVRRAALPKPGMHCDSVEGNKSFGASRENVSDSETNQTLPDALEVKV
jgi:hypothetical protein